MRQYRNRILSVVAAWFIIVLCASALRLFENSSHRIGLAVALAAVIPLLAFAAWYAASAKFREFALSLSAPALTLAQTWRLGGFVFVVLSSYGLLPAAFALPAGYGDMAIGATAPLIAWKLARPRHRNSFIAWQLLGTADLVMAVSLGTAARLLNPGGIPMTLMTTLPLSLVPVFIVPLLLILHLICIAQARRWSVSGDSLRLENGRPAVPEAI